MVFCVKTRTVSSEARTCARPARGVVTIAFLTLNFPGGVAMLFLVVKMHATGARPARSQSQQQSAIYRPRGA